MNHQNRITYFPEEKIEGMALPTRFTFPFYYEPHPLAQFAAAELQQYLDTQTHLDHNFGLQSDQDGMAIGKMFGVLVVQDAAGRPGYLSAFSGKLANSNDHPLFVPPVFDMLVEDSFFLQGIAIINEVNSRVTTIESGTHYQQLKTDLDRFTAQSQQEISDFRKQLQDNRANRKQIRIVQKQLLDPPDYEALEAGLVKQSLHDKHRLNVLISQWEKILESLRIEIAPYEAQIDALKNERRDRSADLQQQLFIQYSFLNKDGVSKSLHEIFSQTAFGKPPAGAGECATPKLLQFAFANGFTPLAMAEFWWGASPRSEIRKHKQYYPACTGKCKPILAHMLEGMPLDDNPMLRVPDAGRELEIVYEDESLVVVNKPAGLLSVPGVHIQESVYTRLKDVWTAIEPLIVHRLDMDTSGLLVVAKTPQAHRHIQRQFLQGTVRKRYRALLSKVLEQSEGEISLPLTADLYNRPRQLVCFKTGRKSLTKWKVDIRYRNTTKVDLWPLTGRTHQLRMHSAHELGLDAPIVGDDLYGTASKRMYLHAANIEFIHPKTKEKVSFTAVEDF